MIDFATIIPAMLGSGAITWLGQAYLARAKTQGEGKRAQITADAELEKHRDSLTFELLGAARTEVTALREQVAALRPMEGHMFHLEQALAYLEALLNAGPNERVEIERSARAFLNRMRRGAQAVGTLANEAQRVLSETQIAERLARETRPKGDNP